MSVLEKIPDFEPWINSDPELKKNYIKAERDLLEVINKPNSTQTEVMEKTEIVRKQLNEMKMEEKKVALQNIIGITAGMILVETSIDYSDYLKNDHFNAGSLILTASILSASALAIYLHTRNTIRKTFAEAERKLNGAKF